MKITINKFTTFSIEHVKEEILDNYFNIEVSNKYFNYKVENLKIGTIELKNLTLDMERLLKDKLDSPQKVDFENGEVSLILFPLAFNNRVIMDLHFIIRNDDGDAVSSYILTFEREDIIAFYIYLCDLLKRQNQFDIPEDYEYMYLYVRYLDVNTVKQFCYLSDDPSIRVGDYVLVDRAGEESLAIVEKIEYYKKEDVPYPLDKTKEIIRRVERSELKQEDSDEDDDSENEQDSYVTFEEFKDLKQDLDAIKDIVKNMSNKLSIKELMRQILRDNAYSDVYYYSKLNIFIEKVDTIYLISKYQRKIFSTEDYKKMIKDSVYINCWRPDDILDVYNNAINICKENKLDYADDFDYNENKVNCELSKIIIDGEDKTKDGLYKFWCEQTYNNLKIYVRDSDLLQRTLDIYKENIGQIIKEKAFVDCTNKIGGIIKNTRTFIISNHIKDLSIFEENSKWGLNVANKDSIFKILDVGKIEDKNYIILLHITDNSLGLMKDLHTNVDDYIINNCKEILNDSIKKDPISELDDEWYSRLFFPVGINKDGKVEKG